LDHDERGRGSFFTEEQREYAFGELDEEGKLDLASFATENQRCRFEFMPIEGRLYFVHD
jgi:hypothetical protein